MTWKLSLFNSFFSLSVFPLLVLTLSVAINAQASDAKPHSTQVDFAGENTTVDTRTAASWVAANSDNQRLPFVIIDKKNARAYVFNADNQLKGVAPVLLGLAVGDDGLEDMSDREVSSLRPAERTTPAGRFKSEPGRNLQGEEIIWLDYAAKIAIHRLRPDHQQERRAKRLITPSIADNRISLGCIVVPVAFFEKVIWPVLGKSRSVVYVLPETRPLHGMLNALQSSAY